jgi:single-stranded-DNA-specific exonuclease
MKFKNWKIQPPRSEAETIEQAGVSPLVAKVLASRGCTTPEEAQEALSCGREMLHDPMLLAGMEQAVERIQLAIQRQELICVYGDYDVDGITATCLLTSRLWELGANAVSYIPNRLNEGYSLNCATLEELAKQNISLIVTVDCGITNMEETLLAKQLGMDVVITDHHECKSELPKAVAVVNPHQPDCPYPFKQLAGVGVALKLALALTPPEERDAVFLAYSDLTAVGTVADVMELTGENRAIVAIGLEQLQRTQRPGLRMLLQEAGLEGKALTSTSISYSLAPRLNAAGRMGCPSLAVELLLTDSYPQALNYARQLCDLNRERQAVELETFQQCATLLEQHPSMREHAIILVGENWHQGVIGIVASRLVERYQLPSFMICLDNGKGKGSCRSGSGFNLFTALEQCADLLDTFGGHEQAAGFTIPVENIPEFRSRMMAIAAHTPPIIGGNDLTIDVTLPDLSLLTLPQVESLQLLEPYGAGNPRPTFLLEGAEVVSCAAVGGGKHLRLQLAKNGLTLDAIFFSATIQEAGLQAGSRVDAAFYPQVNEFRGLRSVQLLITDLRRSLSPTQKDLLLYHRYHTGQLLEREELLRLVPERENFIAVWRYLARPGGTGMVTEAPTTLARNISNAVGRPQLCSTTMVCLEVFHERGLIDLQVNTRQVQIALHRPSQKVDLEASEIMRQLRRMIDNYED